MTIIDNILKNSFRSRTLTETITLADIVLKRVGKVLTQPITIIDIWSFFTHAKGLIFGVKRDRGIGRGTSIR